MIRQAILRVGTFFRLVPKPEFTARRCDTQQKASSLEDDELLVVGQFKSEKWACFNCPGGCGEKIRLNLSAGRRPRWKVIVDWLGRPTVTPSVWQQNDCGCHFFVTRGNVRWCDNSETRTH